MAILTKNDIINGKNNIQEVEFPELGGSLKIRPLTDGEYHRVVMMIAENGIGNIDLKPTIKDGDIDKEATLDTVKLDLDVGKIEDNSFKANCLAISLSLTHLENEETYSPEDVKSFPAGSVEKIALKVYELSGVNDPKKMKQNMASFR
jgi:hypothetical protein